MAMRKPDRLPSITDSKTGRMGPIYVPCLARKARCACCAEGVASFWQKVFNRGYAGLMY